MRNWCFPFAPVFGNFAKLLCRVILRGLFTETLKKKFLADE